MTFSHEEQQKKWDEEHAEMLGIPNMDSAKTSGAVRDFGTFLKEQGSDLVGVEMGCGKGRHVMYFAEESYIAEMTGFDFSGVAVTEASKRAQNTPKARFIEMDATKRWDFEDSAVDFVLDSMALTDIESLEGRTAAIAEAYRILKPGGYYLLYALSPEDEYHHAQSLIAPGGEAHSILRPTGKYEKMFSASELEDLFSPFSLVKEKRIQKTYNHEGKDYQCKHWWRIYQK